MDALDLLGHRAVAAAPAGTPPHLHAIRRRGADDGGSVHDPLAGLRAHPVRGMPRAPIDGVGLNPLLYDEGMRIHPPVLLAGLMSWSVPLARPIALAPGKLGQD